MSPDSLELKDDADTAPARSGLEKLKALAKVELLRVARDRELLIQLTKELPGSAVAVAAPYLGEAIEDLRGLALLAHGIAESSA